MSEPRSSGKTLTTVAVVAFVIVTTLLILPGYLAKWSAKPPEDAVFYATQAVERRTRVFHEDGSFGRIPAGASFGRVVSFECGPSSEARREFGWRGAREVLFDCPILFEDSEGREYAWMFRLIPDEDPAADPSPEGYRTMHIDAAEARAILTALGQMP